MNCILLKDIRIFKGFCLRSYLSEYNSFLYLFSWTKMFFRYLTVDFFYFWSGNRWIPGEQHDRCGWHTTSCSWKWWILTSGNQTFATGCVTCADMFVVLPCTESSLLSQQCHHPSLISWVCHFHWTLTVHRMKGSAIFSC